MFHLSLFVLFTANSFNLILKGFAIAMHKTVWETKMCIYIFEGLGHVCHGCYVINTASIQPQHVSVAALLLLNICIWRSKGRVGCVRRAWRVNGVYAILTAGIKAVRRSWCTFFYNCCPRSWLLRWSDR